MYSPPHRRLRNDKINAPINGDNSPPHRRINKGDELFLIHRHTGLETETSSTSFGTKYTAKQVD